MRLLSILSVFFLLIGTTSAGYGCFKTRCHSKSAPPSQCPSGTTFYKQKLCGAAYQRIQEVCCPMGPQTYPGPHGGPGYPGPQYPGPQQPFPPGPQYPGTQFPGPQQPDYPVYG